LPTRWKNVGDQWTADEHEVIKNLLPILAQELAPIGDPWDQQRDRVSAMQTKTSTIFQH
ncbi:hypothetical protein HAX54_029110, partial [Datura stramonium]|nr:hypothetical protein [Datura stramonium]